MIHNSKHNHSLSESLQAVRLRDPSRGITYPETVLKATKSLGPNPSAQAGNAALANAPLCRGVPPQNTFRHSLWASFRMTSTVTSNRVLCVSLRQFARGLAANQKRVQWPSFTAWAAGKALPLHSARARGRLAAARVAVRVRRVKVGGAHWGGPNRASV